MPDPVLTAEDLAGKLQGTLGKWRLEDGEIRRTYRTHGWKGTVLAAGAVAHLAEVAWHHPDLLLSWDKVEVRLVTHDSGGITEKDLALARQIEAVLTWAPPSPLDGTPLDPRSAYLRAD
jgi:4a-hydroxytetrahydrobiopterin dehydratase